MSCDYKRGRAYSKTLQSPSEWQVGGEHTRVCPEGGTSGHGVAKSRRVGTHVRAKRAQTDGLMMTIDAVEN